MLTRLHFNRISLFIERNTPCILVGFVPLQVGVILAPHALGIEGIFPVSYPTVGVAILTIGIIMAAVIRTAHPPYARRQRMVYALYFLLLLQVFLEISVTTQPTAWLWLSWVYVFAVSAIAPDLLRAGAMLLTNLVVTAVAIHINKNPAAQAQIMDSYLLFGIQSVGLCLLILHIFRQQGSTIRQRYRQKLRKFQELNFFFENMASPVIVKDDNNNLVNLNQPAAALFKTSRYNLMGKNLSQLVPKELADKMLEEDRLILSGEEMPPAIRKLSLPGLEQPQWFRITKKAYSFQHPTRCGVVVTVENIHEQLRYEEQLRQSEKRFKTIFEKAPVGMMMVKDCFSNFIEVNEAFCQLLGYQRQELLELTPAEITHPADKLKALPIIAEAWENGKEFITLEKRFLHKSGRVLHTLLALQLVKESENAPYLIGMALDISARKLYEENLKHKSIQLKQSNDSLKEFAYAASHDLKQPLRTIASFTQLLLRYLPKEAVKPEVHEFAEHIKNGVTRMEALINGLLEYSRIGNSQMNLQVIDVMDTINEVCKSLGQQIKENHAEIDVVLPISKLEADALKFESLLQNLISNAIKYRRAEVTPHIRISAQEQSEYWLFAVEDNGKGIPEDQSEQIFGLYKRLEEDKDKDGTGIGLSLCRRIVNRHGGDIRVKSKVGQGSTFYFTISKHLRLAEKREEVGNY